MASRPLPEGRGAAEATCDGRLSSPRHAGRRARHPRRGRRRGPGRRHRRLSGQRRARRLGRPAPQGHPRHLRAARTCAASPRKPGTGASARSPPGPTSSAPTCRLCSTASSSPRARSAAPRSRTAAPSPATSAPRRPAGDGMPNLMALDAQVELTSREGRRLVPAGDFIDGYRRTVCRPDEIVTALLVPKRSGATRGHFLKLGARKYLVISIVMVAGVIETDAAGRIAAARLAVGACSAVPQRLAALEVRVDRAAVGDGCSARGAVACRAPHAHRRHPRLGRLPPRGGARPHPRSPARPRRRTTGGGPPDAGQDAAHPAHRATHPLGRGLTP